MRIIEQLPEGFLFYSETRTNDGNEAIKIYSNRSTGEFAIVTDVAKIIIIPVNFQGYLGATLTANYINHLEYKLNG